MLLFLRRSSRWAYVTAIAGSGAVMAVDAATVGSQQIFVGTVGFIAVVLASAVLGGWRPGFLATALCVGGYEFFFLPPYYSFRVSRPADLLALFVYVLIGVAISVLCEWLHIAGAGLKQHQGSLQQEIIEHRQAELALRKAESRATVESQRNAETAALLRVTLASIGDGVITTDADGHVTFMNTVAETLTGWKEAEARGETLSEVFRIVNERTRAVVENPCEKVMATGAIVGLANHTILIAKDGKEIPIDDSAAPISDDAGKVLGVVLVFRDATKERAATEALQRLAAIVEHSNDAVIGKTLEGTITSWNAAAKRMYGFTAEEAIGQPVSLIVPPDRRHELAGIMHRLRKGEPIEHLETVRLRKDGSRLDVSLAISPIKDPYGEVIGASKVARDISEAKRAHEAVERSQRHLDDFFEQAPVAIHWAGSDGTILRANQAELDLLGYTKEEYVGRHIAEFHADQDVIEDILARLARHEAIHSYEARLRCKDGTIKHVLIESNVHIENGAFVHTRCFTRDMTARKKAEDNLRFLVDASESVAALVDVHSSMQKLARRAVPAFADWCAFHLVSENGDIQTLAHAHADAEKDAALNELLQRYPVEWNSPSLPVRVLRSGRSELVPDMSAQQFAPAIQDERHRALLEQINVRSSIIVPLDSRGRVIGALTFGRSESMAPFSREDLQLGEDLAKRAATAIENCRLYEELRLADRQKDDFLAMLAHELRNPLAAISYAGQLLSTSPEYSVSAIDIVGRQVKQLSNLINDLLDVSRITRGMIQLKKEPIDARTLIERALGTTDQLLKQQEHTVSREISAEPMPMFVDPTRLEQILVNLISNAAKYTPKGGHVGVAAFCDADQIIIRVKDTGVGIPQEMLPRVFDMFTQVNPSIDRAQGGLGIGLTIVRRLVEMHDGTVSASSEGLGKGTEFTLRIPIGRVQAHDSASEQKPGAPRTGLRVLVVDDNVDTATTISLLLKKAGCITETAYDGPSALDVAQRLHPDVAVLDIGLPGLDGFEVAQRIRANAELNHVKLIAVSGYGQEKDRLRARDSGFDHYLVKPVQIEALTALLAR